MAQPHVTIIQIYTEEVDLGHSHNIKSTTARVIINSTEHALVNTTDMIGDITGLVQADSISTHIHTTLTMTPYIKDPPLIVAHQPFH